MLKSGARFSGLGCRRVGERHGAPFKNQRAEGQRGRHPEQRFKARRPGQLEGALIGLRIAAARRQKCLGHHAAVGVHQNLHHGISQQIRCGPRREFGRIEEITLTYVVVRVWDLRRLIVPISDFIEKPFQNWTRSSADLLATVFLHVDYTMPIAALRAELTRILEASTRWDRKVNVLQMTDSSGVAGTIVLDGISLGDVNEVMGQIHFNEIA